MARQRHSASQLARLLDASDRPIYILDGTLRIVFLNRACREWLGPVAEELVGRQCVYASAPGRLGPDAAADQLCPPPTVLTGREVTADVARATDSGVVYRRARFVPLMGEKRGTVPLFSEETFAIVALLGASDCPEPGPVVPAGEAAESQELHERVRAYRLRAASRVSVDRLIGPSPAIRRARAQVDLAAGCRASVLLVGPNGSGRRRSAEAIHYAPCRDAVGTLIPLDCSVLSADLILSTLRALALGNPLGQQAARSTLLLLAADRIPAEIQGELAAVLASPGFVVRLTATAETPLVEAARRGQYGYDLAALLSTITIELPPLAERREDLPLLAQALVEELNAAGVKQLAGFSPEALDRLDAHRWTGNIEELAQVVAESHQRAAGPIIRPDDLPERLRLAADAAARPRREEPIVLAEVLAQIERELIGRALARAKGNKAKAARLLGLNRPRLYRRMLLLGLLEEGEGA